MPRVNGDASATDWAMRGGNIRRRRLARVGVRILPKGRGNRRRPPGGAGAEVARGLLEGGQEWLPP